MNSAAQLNYSTDCIFEKRTDEVSSNQLQFWIIEKIHPGASAYNIPSVMKLKGNLNLHALEKSVSEVIRRHEIFRTTFAEKEGIPLQIISGNYNPNLEIIDISGRNTVQEIDSEINQIFSLGNGPLIRLKLFRLNDQEHILAITMHHIITDLRTREIFSNELSEFYNSIVENKEIDPASRPYQYSFYSHWQKQFFDSDNYRKMISNWEEILSDVRDYLDFPVDKNYPPVLKLNGKEVYFDIPEEIGSELKKLCRTLGVDIFVLLLTAYSVLLHRYSGQTDFCIGVPFTNRRMAEFRDVTGCFMNILPVPVRIPETMSFIESMSAVRRMMLIGHRNQEVPFERIVATIKSAKNNPSYNPIFQYGFTFDPPMNLEFKGISSISLPVNQEGARLNLFCSMWPEERSFRGRLAFNSDIFRKETILRFIENYIKLLSSILNNPRERISLLDILSDKERKIIAEWNNTRCGYSSDKCIHNFLEETAIGNPSKTAVFFQEESLSYYELNRLANQAANLLISKGIRPGDMVGLCMERSIEMIIYIFGILKSGGVYVPLDPNYPNERLQFIMEDAEIKIMLTQQKFVPKLSSFSCEIFAADKIVFKGEPDSNPEGLVNPKDIAYVIYTSGSTGKPKGVMIEHHSVVNRIEWMQKKYPLSDRDIILQKTTVTFDVSIWELFWWSFYGSSVCFLPPGMEKYPDSIIDEIEKHSISVMHFSPSMLHAFLFHVEMSNETERLASLKQVFASGEALTLNIVNLFNRLLNKTNQTRLANLYGPTEATVDVSYFDCSEGNNLERIPIGRPIDNTELYVLDMHNNIQPVGASGELVIGGVGLARGYINRPELTKEKFTRIRICNDEKPVYRTGDLARFLSDGNIEYLGRLDHQVKIRGFRIELGEIENLLQTNHYISEAVVIAKEFIPGDRKLIAFISLKNKNPDNTSKIIEDLRRYLKAKLPDYMVPSFFSVLERIPLLTNGKADRKALLNHKIDVFQRSDTTPLVSPSGETEKIVLDCWKKVLKTENIGTESNFFDLGGNSLLTVQLQFELNAALGRKIEILTIFEYPTVKKFAAFLNSGGAV